MTEPKYHLLCEKCGYDRWSEDGFQECPKCENQDLLTLEERDDQEVQQRLAKLKRLGWKSPEVDDTRLIYKEKVLEQTLKEIGEWLEKRETFLQDEVHVIKEMEHQDIERLKSGKMPREGK